MGDVLHCFKSQDSVPSNHQSTTTMCITVEAMMDVRTFMLIEAVKRAPRESILHHGRCLEKFIYGFYLFYAIPVSYFSMQNKNTNACE